MATGGGGDTPPPGIRPIWIQMKNYSKYGLTKTPIEDDGAQVDMSDCKSHVFLDRMEILSEIEKYGFMVDFYDYKADLQKFDGAQILLVCDVTTKRFGEDWFFCYSHEAFEMERTRIQEEAEVAAIEKEEAEQAAEQEEELPVFVDAPLEPSADYVSETAEDSFHEVDNLTLRPRRQPFRVTVTRPASLMGTPCKFSDRDAKEWIPDEMMHKIGIKKYQDVAFNAYDPASPDIKLVDSGCQAAPLCTIGSSQTTWRRPRNASVQCSPQRLSRAQCQQELSTERMIKFLASAAPLIEEVLEANEMIDMFTDSYNLIDAARDDEPLLIGRQNDMDLKELRTFTDLEHSKNRTLAAIDWIPQEQGLVAVSPVRYISFQQWLQASGHVSASHILVWDFNDLITPVFRLAAPHEVHTFRFSVHHRGVIVAGTASGQIAMWDISEAMVQERMRKKAQSKRHLSGNAAEDHMEEGPKPSIRTSAVSHIDASHRRSVADLAWLPPNIQINSRGKFLSDDHLDGTSYQFVTVAADGLCLFWDIRYKEIAAGELPHISRPRAMDKKRDDGSAASCSVPWAPIFRVQLNRTEGVGELSLCRLVSLTKATDAETASQIICATEEGEILVADWQARTHGGEDAGAAQATGEEDADSTQDFVLWVAKDQTRPCLTLLQSPFYEDMVLSVADWGFQVWRIDQQQAVFTSPKASAHIKCGSWSPTRPGTIFLGKDDGSIDVWDLADSSYRPVATLLACPSPITSLEFPHQPTPSSKQGKAARSTQQLLAVGDAAGNLHIYDVPQNFWRPSANEKNMVRSFFQREQVRANYFAQRVAEREEVETQNEEPEFSPRNVTTTAAGETPAQPTAGATAQTASSAGGGGGAPPSSTGGTGQEGGDDGEAISADIKEAEKLYRAFEEDFKNAFDLVPLAGAAN